MNWNKDFTEENNIMEDAKTILEEGSDRKIEEDAIPASRNADMSEMDGASILNADGQTAIQTARRAKLVQALSDLTDGFYVPGSNPTKVGEYREELERIVVDPAVFDSELRREKIVKKCMAAIRILVSAAIVGGTYLVGDAIIEYIESWVEQCKNAGEAACELLKKGQPLPDSPDEVELPGSRSIYELVSTCMEDYGVNVTYGCAVQGILRTKGLNHEPSEFQGNQEDLLDEALQMSGEQCVVPPNK